MAYWLMKSEPGDYAIDDLARDKRDWWTGVRNYQARNFMRDDMQIGDTAFFYHSSCPAPGIYGAAKVSAKAQADETQFDPDSPYFDPKSTTEKPRWVCVQIAFAQKFESPLLLHEMRRDKALRGLAVLRPGNRLSITPVSDLHGRRMLHRRA